MTRLLEEAAEAMDMPFWVQNYGDPEPLLASIPEADVRRYVRLNYGPWDRMYGDEPLISGVGDRPLGANFYPADMTTAEFEASAAVNPALKSSFTMVRRDENRQLRAIPYHEFFEEHVQIAAEKLRQAAEVAESEEMRKFLKLRAEALLTDEYRASDYAWMELKDNSIELLLGPMEIEDRLFGIKTAYSASILFKDKESSARLSRYRDMLPRFQESLPVPAVYKQEKPGLEADLAVYEVIRFAGLDARDVPVGIAWPDDEEIQLRKGLRSLLLKDVMRAKFEGIFTPLAQLLIAKEQRQYVHFGARFNMVMFHEFAHGLGIKETINGRGLVREALGELQHAVEEGKADLVGLFMALQLFRWGQLKEEELLALYVTSLVSQLYNSDGTQAVMHLNYFLERGAYSRDPRTGTYQVHAERMPVAIESLAEKLLRFQGEGDRAGVQAFMKRYGRPDESLKQDIARMDSAGLPLGLQLSN